MRESCGARRRPLPFPSYVPVAWPWPSPQGTWTACMPNPAGRHQVLGGLWRVQGLEGSQMQGPHKQRAPSTWPGKHRPSAAARKEGRTTTHTMQARGVSLPFGLLTLHRAHAAASPSPVLFVCVQGTQGTGTTTHALKPLRPSPFFDASILAFPQLLLSSSHQPSHKHQNTGNKSAAARTHP